MAYVLGVDAGNRQTFALIADDEGYILGAGRRGCGNTSNPHLPEEVALKHVEQAVGEALELAQLDAYDLSCACMGMAGAIWPEDFSFLKRHFSKKLGAQELLITNQAFGALRAASLEGHGLAIMGGIEVVSAVKDGLGQSWYSGYWQQGLGSEALGRQVLESIREIGLGIEVASSLGTRLCEVLKLDSLEDLLHAFYNRRKEAPLSLYQLAPFLIEEADKGDKLCQSLLKRHGERLGQYVLAALKKSALAEDVLISLSGDLFRLRSKLLYEALLDKVKTAYPQANMVYAELEAVVGGVMGGLEHHLHHPITAEIFSKLKSTSPDSSFFC
ncbi:MAG: BadF/BadG/BcrA/BcrD ATPase family protein [Deinococcales bacterium]